MAKQLNVPDVHFYDVELVDADGNPKTLRLQGVREGRDVEAMKDFIRRNPAMLNDGRGRAPRRFVGIRKVETSPDAAAAHRPKLPPGLEEDVAKAEGREPDAGPGLPPPPDPLLSAGEDAAANA